MSLFTILTPFQHFWKIKPIQIYNNIFNLHCKVTVSFLLIFSVIVSLKEYFGDPIDCVSDLKDTKSFINTFCWITGTYINKNSYTGEFGVDLISIGIGMKFANESEKDYQKYYQWVALMLVLQAISFYIPAYLWKIWENGRMKMICQKLTTPIVPPEWDKQRKEIIVEYLKANKNTSIHRIYVLRFLFCELINFIIVILNILFVNMIFSEFWFNYTPAMQSLLSYDYSTWNSYSSRVFPKMAKCDFYHVGPSGGIQIKDVFCVLPLNIINEKIYAFLWFWFMFLLCVSSINIVWRLFLLSCRKIRIKILQSQTLSLQYTDVKKITNNGNIGEWYILYQMSRNLNPIIFQDILDELKGKKKKDISIENI